MPLTLTTATDYVETLLADATNVKWSTAEISFALRQALGEVSVPAGVILTLNGLDGAGATTLPGQLEAAFISGAAGYCAAIRVGARADWESQAEGEPVRLASWSSVRLSEFRRQVTAYYAAKKKIDEASRVNLIRSTATPWGKWADDFGERGKDDLH